MRLSSIAKVEDYISRHKNGKVSTKKLKMKEEKNMSMRIDNGFLFFGDLKEALNYFRQKREEFLHGDIFKNAVCYAQFRKLCELVNKMRSISTGTNEEKYNQAVVCLLPEENAIDLKKARLSFDDFISNPFIWARRFVSAVNGLNESAKYANEMDMQYDFNMRCVLFPYDDVIFEKTIGIFYGGSAYADETEKETVLQKFMKYCGLFDFSYWDNTDKPDDLDDEEWKDREDTWNQAISSLIPNIDGLSYIVTSSKRDDFLTMPLLKIADAEKMYQRNKSEIIGTESAEIVPPTFNDFLDSVATR